MSLILPTRRPLVNRAAATVARTVSPPTRSLSFASASSQTLSIASADWGAYNRAKWAYSVYFTRASTGAQQPLFGKSNNGGSASTEFYILINSSGKINFTTYSAGGVLGQLITTATYEDTNEHHLLVHYDGLNATAGDRMKMWVDGSEITAFDTDTNPAQAAVQTLTEAVRIGGLNAGAGVGYFNGLQYQPAFYSGSLLAIGDVYNAGVPKSLSETGLYSLLNTNADDALEDDYVLTTNWTNNGTVTKSTTIPS